MDAPALELEDVSFAYEKGVTALSEVTLTVDPSEHIVILGPNGAGKTTLLKIMAGLVAPSSGTVKLYDKELYRKEKRNPEERDGKVIGILFQDPDDQIFMPRVFDDVAFGPINLGLEEREVMRRVETALELTNLKGYEERVPHHLSYGEKKKVAIAGVLAMEPDILLLDEPTANLDPKTKNDLIGIIREFHGTVIAATHDVNSSVLMAERGYVLDKRIAAEGGLDDIFSDEKLLKEANLDIPDTAKLFLELKREGLDFEKLPLSVKDAVEELVKRGVKRDVHKKPPREED